MARLLRSLTAGLVALLALTQAAGGSAAGVRFYDDDPLWVEPETQDASGVQPWSIDLAHDLIQNLFLKPGDRATGVRAANVNTVDEVPDSSWFTNRIGMRPLDAAELVSPPGGEGPARGRWVITSAKSDGITPGFTIRDTTGQVWFLKFDPPGHSGMATGTEVVVTNLMRAIGFHVPDNYIARFRREDLVIAEAATVTPAGARRRPMRPGDIDNLLQRASRSADGWYRAIASRALEGKPLGGFRFYGTRPDDPNDIVLHEHRRELRAYGVFSAWVNHVDSKSINTLDTLIERADGLRVVRHHLLDFGSTLGSAAVEPRLAWEGDEHMYEGHRQVGLAVLTLGWRVQPWRTRGYYESPAVGRLPLDNSAWDPESWRPRVPNPAFLRARADDKFWAARRVAAFSDELLRAAVRSGEFVDEDAEAFLVRALAERRDAIARAYLPAINPVVEVMLTPDGELIFRNAAVDAGVAAGPRGYTSRWAVFDNHTGSAREFSEASASVPRIRAPEGLPEDEGLLVRIAIAAVDAPVAAWHDPLVVFFRRTGGAWTLVGLDRQPE